MTTPDSAGNDPYQPGDESARRPGEPGEATPPAPVGAPWDWSIDPPPPETPRREPTGDPSAGGTVDEPPDPAPEATSPATLPPPPWSTPDTPVAAPPIGGQHSEVPTNPQDPPYGESPSPVPGFASGPAANPPGPAGPAPAGERRLGLILIIIAALLVGCCAITAVSALAWGPDIYAVVRDRQRAVGLNQSARDGDLEFRVHAVRCGFDRVGDPYVNQAAVGQFCAVELTIRNLGPRPATFVESLQKAYGPAGEQFHADSTAGILANADQQVFLGQINPGNPVTGAVIYDIPPDSRIIQLRLHGTAGSRGVLVRTG